LASACADAEPDAEPAADAPPAPPLCAKAAVELNAVVRAKIPAITKGFFIVVSGVLRMMHIAAKKRRMQQFGPLPEIKKISAAEARRTR
jgi:hypothetical protein